MKALRIAIPILFISVVAAAAIIPVSTTIQGDLTVIGLTASTVPYADANKKLTSSAITPTQLDYLGTAGSNICGISDTCSVTNRTLDGVSPTTMGYVDFTSSGQTQLDAKLPKSAFALKGDILVGTGSGTYANVGVGTDGQGLVADSTQTSGVKWGTVSGAGGTNAQTEYISNGTAESNTTGWATYNDGAVSQPVDGTGGTPTVTFARATSPNNLVGTASFEIANNTAGSIQGQGVSYDFTVDPAQYNTGVPVALSFTYKSSSNLAAGDLYVYVYDVSGSKLLTVLDMNNDGGEILPNTTGASWTGEFYPVSGDSSYRLIFHVASTSTSNWNLLFDSVHAGSMDQVPGAIVSDWRSDLTFTPSASFGTTSNSTFKYRRVGDSAEVFFSFKAGTTSASAASIALPFTIDSSKLSTATNASIVGVDVIGATTSQTLFGGNYGNAIFFDGSDTSSVYFSESTGATSNQLSKTDASSLASGTYTITGHFTVPVANWSASAALSTSDAMLSTVKVRADMSGGATTLPSGSVTDLAWTELKDPTGVFDGTYFKAPKKMTVIVNGVIHFAATSGAGVRLIGYSINSGADVVVADISGASSQASYYIPYAFSVDLNQGDTLKIQAEQTSGASSTAATDSLVSFTEQPDFSIFSTYGQFQVLTVTSSVKTPSASGNYSAMTGNSIPLPSGTWRLTMSIAFDDNGTSSGWQGAGGGWFAANGADSSSAPSALSNAVTLVSSIDTPLMTYQTITSASHLNISPVIVACTSSCTVYAVPYSLMSTPANARITVYANAERLQ